MVRASEQYLDSWNKVSAFWNDHSAQSFRERFLVPIHNYADEYDTETARMNEHVSSLQEELALLEGEISCADAGR